MFCWYRAGVLSLLLTVALGSSVARAALENETASPPAWDERDFACVTEVLGASGLEGLATLDGAVLPADAAEWLVRLRRAAEALGQRIRELEARELRFLWPWEVDLIRQLLSAHRQLQFFTRYQEAVDRCGRRCAGAAAVVREMALAYEGMTEAMAEEQLANGSLILPHLQFALWQARAALATSQLAPRLGVDAATPPDEAVERAAEGLRAFRRVDLLRQVVDGIEEAEVALEVRWRRVEWTGLASRLASDASARAEATEWVRSLDARLGEIDRLQRSLQEHLEGLGRARLQARQALSFGWMEDVANGAFAVVDPPVLSAPFETLQRRLEEGERRYLRARALRAQLSALRAQAAERLGLSAE